MGKTKFTFQQGEGLKSGIFICACGVTTHWECDVIVGDYEDVILNLDCMCPTDGRAAFVTTGHSIEYK